MEIDLNFTGEMLKIVLPICLVTICFILYFFITKSEKRKEKFQNKYGERHSEKFIMNQRILGFVFFGIIPLGVCLIFLSYPVCFYGLAIKKLGTSLLWIAALAALIIPMTILSSKKEQNLQMYPQIRSKTWNERLIILSALTWMLYLLGYEILFRGVLLFPLANELGFWPAVIINTSIYALVHVPSGARESIGAIPLGLLLCYISLSTGSILAAFIVHVIMALTNEWASLKYNPEMSISRKE